MPFLIPKKLVVKSPLSKSRFLTKLNERLYFPKERGIFKVNKLLKNQWFSEVFYGSVRENAFTVFMHRPRKYDGGGVRFNGVAVDTNNGLVVAGYLRQSISAYITGFVVTALLLMAGIVLYVENPMYGLLCLLLLVIFDLLIFSGRKNASAIEAFIKELARSEGAELPEQVSQEENTQYDENTEENENNTDTGKEENI